MSYVMDLHRAHKERVVRLGGVVAKSVVARKVEAAEERAAAVAQVWPELPEPPPIPQPVFITREEYLPVPRGWKDIVKDVCRKHEVSLSEVLGPQRSRHITAARHEAFYRLSKETTLSLVQIGYRMGGKHHTTVMWGIQQHRERMREAA